MKRDKGEVRRKLFRVRGDRPNVRRDLDAELEFHFQEIVDALVENGCSTEDAKAEATRRCKAIITSRRKLTRLGRTRRLKLVLRDLGNVLVDHVRWALRGVVRRPGFSAVIIGTLALGIGANTLVFGVVDRLLLSPPPLIVDADQVKHLYLERTEQSGSVAQRRFSYPDYMDLNEVSGIREVGGYRHRDALPVGVREEVRPAYVVPATHSLFPLLGIRPLLGRFFHPEDDAAGAAPTAVLSEEFWAERFGRDSTVLGSTVSIGDWWNTIAHEIVGIAPAGFTGTEMECVDIWVPIVPEISDRMHRRDASVLKVVARLEEGVLPEDVDREATLRFRAIRAGWAEEEGVDRDNSNARVFTSSTIAARGPNPSAVSAITKWLAALSLIVLVVACANVTNLLLANNIRIRRELVTRASLGAGPLRIALQLLTQTAVLATLGGITGLVLWYVFSPVMHGTFIPDAEFSYSETAPRAVGFAGIAVLVACLGAGLAPALQVWKLKSLTSMRVGSRSSTAESSHLRYVLIATQTALSVLLLIGAGLFVMSLRRAKDFDMGFSAEGVAEAHVEFRGGVGYPRRKEIFSETLSRLRSLPGVRASATYSGSQPLEGGMNAQLRIPGRDSIPTMPGGLPHYFQGTADFLDAYGFRVVKGRAPERSDAQVGAEPVMLVSAMTERILWPDGGALNRCAHVEGDETPSGEGEPCRRIIGVFDDVVVRSLDELSAFAFFVPVEVDFAMPWGVVLRADVISPRLLESVRNAVSEIGADVFYTEAHSILDRVDNGLRQWSLGAWLFTAFGVLGLVLANVGLYSILAFDVAQRRRELGIKSALGAQKAFLVGSVLRRSSAHLGAGLLLGVAVAMMAGPFIQNLLFQTSYLDLGVYSVVVGTLLVSGIAACLFPSFRAATSDPLEVIRAE